MAHQTGYQGNLLQATRPLGDNCVDDAQLFERFPVKNAPSPYHVRAASKRANCLSAAKRSLRPPDTLAPPRKNRPGVLRKSTSKSGLRGSAGRPPSRTLFAFLRNVAMFGSRLVTGPGLDSMNSPTTIRATADPDLYGSESPTLLISQETTLLSCAVASAG